MVAIRTPRTPPRRPPPRAGASRLARALAGALLAGAALAPPARAAPPDDEARRHFRAGVNLLEDPDGARYEEAYQEFKTAYELTQEPKILGNVALCAMKLERDGEAIAAYQKYLQAVPDVDPDERAQVQRDLQTLGAGLVRISLGADAPDARVLDTRLAANGRKVVNVYGPASGPLEVGIHAGHHVMVASAPGRADVTWEFSAAAGARETHAFVLPGLRAAPAAAPARPGGPEGRPRPLAPWLLAGLGGAAAAGGAVAGLIALQKEAALADRCPQNACPPGVDEHDRGSLRATANLSTGLLAGGGALTAVGLGWLLFGPGGPPDRPAAPSDAPPPAARAALGGACTPQGCVGALRVAF